MTASSPEQSRARRQSQSSLNEDTGTNTEVVASRLSVPSLLCDEKFYLDDGDCIIRVEKTLFKVHRFLLSRDDSAFQNMFSLGHLACGLEGLSKECPILLQDETVERFKFLLFILYALPDTTSELCNPQCINDVEQLLTLTEITNKYHFARIERWACRALLAAVSNQQLWTLSRFPASQLLEISYLCNHKELRVALLEEWIPRLSRLSLDPTPALLVADKYDLMPLQAAAYYSQVLQMARTSVDGALPPGCPLSQEQYTRLLRAHWWLSRRWDFLSANPPIYEHSEECVNTDLCVSFWTGVWDIVCRKAAGDKSGALHVLGRLESVKESVVDRLNLYRSYGTAIDNCHGGIKQALKEFVENFPLVFLAGAIRVKD